MRENIRLRNAIKVLPRDKTIVMIAPRPKTVRHANQSLCRTRGGIMQRGRHEELIGQPGIYAVSI